MNKAKNGFVILGWDDSELCYWSNENGWGSVMDLLSTHLIVSEYAFAEAATVFTRFEIATMNMPPGYAGEIEINA